MTPRDIIVQFGLETSTEAMDFLIAADCAEDHFLPAFANLLRSHWPWLCGREGLMGQGYGDNGGEEWNQAQGAGDGIGIGYGAGLFDSSGFGHGQAQSYGCAFGNGAGMGDGNDFFHVGGYARSDVSPLKPHERQAFGNGSGQGNGYGPSFHDQTDRQETWSIGYGQSLPTGDGQGQPLDLPEPDVLLHEADDE